MHSPHSFAKIIVAEQNDSSASDKVLVTVVPKCPPLEYDNDADKEIGETDKDVSAKNMISVRESYESESLTVFAAQAFAPFVLAGCGMVAAGILLERANHWTFFTRVPEATILVVALLGLKGNLEMTLASRLSTMTNLGRMASPSQILRAYISNVALVQAQATIVSLVAAMIAIVTYSIEGAPFDITRTVCLTVTAITTASVASLVLTNLMIIITIVTQYFRINPDNVATPVAAATGDVTTLFFLVVFGALFYKIKEELLYLNVSVLILLIGATPLWMWVASRESSTLEVLKFGWFAILTAMLISSAGGYILKRSISLYPHISLFQPVINGAGGNLVAVQASKISTYLHRFGKYGVLPMNNIKTYLNPIATFTGEEVESAHACILLLMAIPGHLIFLCILVAAQPSNQFHLNWQFFTFYFVTAILQAAILLYLCQLLSRLIWRAKCDPDNNSIPLLTAAGDLLGTLLLGAAFHLNFIMSNDISNTVSLS